MSGFGLGQGFGRHYRSGRRGGAVLTQHKLDAILTPGGSGASG